MRKFISLLLSMSLIMTVAAVSGATTTVYAAEETVIDWNTASCWAEGGTIVKNADGSVTANKPDGDRLVTASGIDLSSYIGIKFTATPNNGNAKTAVQVTFNDKITSSSTTLNTSGSTECIIYFKDTNYKAASGTKIRFEATGSSPGIITFSKVYGITEVVTTKATTTTTTAAPQTTTQSSGQTKTMLIDWTKAKDAYAESEPNINLKLDDPTGYIHASGTTQKNSNYSDIIVFWGLNLEGYDQIQFTAYGTGSIRFKLNNNTEYDDYVLSGNSTTITLDVSNFTGTSYPFRFQVLTNKQPTAIDLYISDIYGIKGGSATSLPVVTMEKGAAMRIDGRTYGIRFSATVSTADLTAFKNEGNEIKDFGMLIAPKESNLSTAQMIVDNSQELKEVGTLASGKNSVVAKYNGLYPMDHAASGLTQIVGSLIEIAEVNANKEYVARAYVRYENNGTTQYLYSDISDARSLAWVAYTIRAEGEAKPNDKTIYYNQLCEEHKFEVNKWANLYNSSETTTTGTTQQMSTFDPKVDVQGNLVVDFDQNQQQAIDQQYLYRVVKEDGKTSVIKDYIYIKNKAALPAGKVYQVFNWWNDFNGYYTFKFYAQGSGKLRIQLDDVVIPGTSNNYVTDWIDLDGNLNLYEITLPTTIGTGDNAITLDVSNDKTHNPTIQYMPDKAYAAEEMDLYISDFYSVVK